MIKETFAAIGRRTPKSILETHEKMIGMDRAFHAFIFAPFFWSSAGKKEKMTKETNTIGSRIRECRKAMVLS